MYGNPDKSGHLSGIVRKCHALHKNNVFEVSTNQTMTKNYRALQSLRRKVYFRQRQGPKKQLIKY